MNINDELRLGNTILGGYVKRGGDLDWLKLSGLPLTPEWLEKQGFIRDFKFFTLKDFELEYQDGVFWYRTVKDLIPLEYAHQVENLYLILHGKELMDETT